jgi:integrase
MQPEKANSNQKSGGEVAEQVPEPRASRSAIDDLRFWKKRVFHPGYTRNGRRIKLPEFSVRIQKGGTRRTFNLATANRDKAARKAARIHANVVANGWEDTLAQFAPRPDTERLAGAKVTVGDYLIAAEAVFDGKPKTFRLYGTYLRRLIADIFRIDGGKAKWDYRSGGRNAWVKKIDSVPLAALTPAKLQAWRVAFTKRARNPAARASAIRSSNSYLRCARALFSPTITRFVSEQLELPDPLPFSGLKIERPHAPRYQSRINLPLLIAAARNELRDADSDVYLALLLAIGAGLRKGEIDSLRWEQVDFARQTLRLEISEYADLKTEESADEVEIDEALAGELRAQMSRARGPFVIESGRPARTSSTARNYRSQPVFQRLYAWLRQRGITDRKPLHLLRKEFGSIINQRHGLYAASAALRHRNIATTAGHYVGNKSRISFEFADLLSSPSVRPLSNIRI